MILILLLKSALYYVVNIVSFIYQDKGLAAKHFICLIVDLSYLEKLVFAKILTFEKEISA